MHRDGTTTISRPKQCWVEISISLSRAFAVGDDSIESLNDFSDGTRTVREKNR